MASTKLPNTMKALVLEAIGQPLGLKSVPVPQPTPGSVLVKIECAYANPSLPHILSGRFFSVPTPMTPGGTAIGRVAALGPDTTSLQIGQLVLLDSFIRGRDNGDVQILWGIFDGPSPASKKLMADNWSSGVYAEYTRAPLENCWALDETRLCSPTSQGGLGYSLQELMTLALQAIPFGGVRSIDLQPGETIIVAPSTGTYSGAAVGVALAFGANVIVVGRDEEKLRGLQATYPQVKTVVNTGDVEADAAALRKPFGPVDAYIDISPPQANDSTHVRSCFLALKQGGRAALQGLISKDIAIPYSHVVWNNLTIKGRYMYEREDIRRMVKMAECGVLKLGKAGGWDVTGTFRLEGAGRTDEVFKAESIARLVTWEGLLFLSLYQYLTEPCLLGLPHSHTRCHEQEPGLENDEDKYLETELRYYLEDACTAIPTTGTSIGPCQAAKRTGTLAGYVRVEFKRKPGSEGSSNLPTSYEITAGLTCHHVVSISPVNEREHWLRRPPAASDRLWLRTTY
ncbi:uncharacterized protein E0L32_008680 [Thyridium curvatum]|uniref:Alcohol dehydrogenase n=1 Tax=Thyridium curvatum TaxID=1093900 RepID=A0A507AJ40_9PEZI|nr:uncharacterized protein E0L32_008680 [Thyridium curvatum]TPX10275.1 hypothetical protein E0L32_008680 [Thyridium curvatum]